MTYNLDKLYSGCNMTEKFENVLGAWILLQGIHNTFFVPPLLRAMIHISAV